MVADQPGRRQLGVALHQHERHAGAVGQRAQQRRLPGARWALEDDVAAGRERGRHDLRLPDPGDDPLPGDPHHAGDVEPGRGRGSRRSCAKRTGVAPRG